MKRKARHSLPKDVVFRLLLDQPDAFQHVRDVVYPSLLYLTQKRQGSAVDAEQQEVHLHSLVLSDRTKHEYHHRLRNEAMDRFDGVFFLRRVAVLSFA
jgi:hypothetical protein